MALGGHAFSRTIKLSGQFLSGRALLVSRKRPFVCFPVLPKGLMGRCRAVRRHNGTNLLCRNCAAHQVSHEHPEPACSISSNSAPQVFLPYCSNPLFIASVLCSIIPPSSACSAHLTLVRGRVKSLFKMFPGLANTPERSWCSHKSHLWQTLPYEDFWGLGGIPKLDRI